MELEVRAVGGIENCFVSLPVSFIDTLLITNGGSLPPVLALELSSRSGHHWHVAWSGSASTSFPRATEISQQLAASISLSDHTFVQVKAAANLSKAERVILESITEDDWEILELNSKVAEGDILTQGSGKTLLATAVAKHLEGHKEILAHITFVSCSKLSLEKSQSIRQALTGYIAEALQHSPCLVIFDDLDAIVSSPESEGPHMSNSVIALVDFLTDIMDEYVDKWWFSCGVGQIAFIASVQSLDNLPNSLTSSGRLDFHVQLPALAELY